MYSRSVFTPEGSNTMSNKKSNNSKPNKASNRKLNRRLNNLERRLSNLAGTAIANGSSSRSTNSAMSTVRIHNRERISTVSALGPGFSVTTLKINPALSSSFPWLSNIARMFDKYQFHRLVFHYKTFVPTSTAGSVSLAYDPDTLDSPPFNAETLTHEAKWSTNSVWKSFSISIDCSKNGFLYTRTGNPANVDLKTYDWGQLFLATEGVPLQDLGYVEVDYDVTLKDKQPNL